MQDPGFGSLDDDKIVQRLAVTCGDRAAEVLASYKSRRPEATAAELWLDLATDGIFRIPMIRLLEAQHAHGPVWSYLFSWESPAFGGLLRSTHALEIPFVWNTIDKAGVEMSISSITTPGVYFAEGFGNGNFQALYESIELDQIRRGVITVDA